ncbi:hypothetical protein pb186bvf_014524 [Paramecium bursaria]
MLFLLIQIAIGFETDKHLTHLILQEQPIFHASDPKPFPNIDYLFSGYDLYKANPLTWSQSSDPGFTGRSIFNPQYKQKLITIDGRHKIPDNSFAVMRKGCLYKFDSQILRSTEKIQNYFSSFVGLNMISNFQLTPWAFTASPEFNYMQQDIEQKSMTFIATHASCQVAEFTHNVETQELSDYFMNQLKALPVEYSSSQYIEFIETFGTHFVTNIIYGSRAGYYFSLQKNQVIQQAQQGSLQGEVLVEKFQDDELLQAASTTGALLKKAMAEQVLPSEQGKSFTDLSKLSQQTFSISIGPQTKEADPKKWLEETIGEPIPIKYQLKNLADFIAEGKGKVKEIKDYEKIANNIRNSYTEYCKLLSLQNKRFGQCEPNKREISQWYETRQICLNFFISCDWSSKNVRVCGNKNPIQDLGKDLPEVQANSVRFHSERNIILGSSKFKREQDQAEVFKSFNEDYIILDKAEVCLINQGMLANSVYPVYITDSTKCVILFLWNACDSEVHYFTSVICGTLDETDVLKPLLYKDGKCEIAILDIKYPNSQPLRICLFKETKMGGAKVYIQEHDDRGA